MQGSIYHKQTKGEGNSLYSYKYLKENGDAVLILSPWLYRTIYYSHCAE